MPIWRYTAPRPRAGRRSSSSRLRWERICAPDACSSSTCARRCPTPAGAGLSTSLQPGAAADYRLRGAPALASPVARPGLAGRFHPGHGADGPDQRGRGVGAASGLQRMRCSGPTISRSRSISRPSSSRPRTWSTWSRPPWRRPASRPAGSSSRSRNRSCCRPTTVCSGPCTTFTAWVADRDGRFRDGYSSLSYLRQFPFDKIKIDKSFVGEMADRPDCAAIVTWVAMLASNLGMVTVAEGVEPSASTSSCWPQAARKGKVTISTGRDPQPRSWSGSRRQASIAIRRAGRGRPLAGCRPCKVPGAYCVTGLGLISTRGVVHVVESNGRCNTMAEGLR